MVATWIAAGVVLVLVAVVGVLLLTQGGESEQAKKDEVLERSERFALAFTSYDHRQLDDDLARAEAFMTAGFQETYRSTLAGVEFQDTIRQKQTVSTAKIVIEPLLATLDDDAARTFTLVEQTVRTSDLQEPLVERTRLELFFVEDDGQWKVDRVETST